MAFMFVNQTFTECVSNQYAYFDMSDVTANYQKSLDFISFFGYFHTSMSEVLHIHQTLTDCISKHKCHSFL